MGQGTSSPVVGVVLLLVLASAALFALGIYLRKTGRIRSPAAGLVLALLAIAPLFGGGLYMFTHHMAMKAEGVTQPGVHGQRDERR
jgi:high-affinity Fe2+/Pb2+ permease